MATKQQITEALDNLKIDYDAKAKKDELFALLPDEIKQTFADRPAEIDPTVQLMRNAAGHQVGETFRRSRAEKLGILDATRPFPDAETR